MFVHCSPPMHGRAESECGTSVIQTIPYRQYTQMPRAKCANTRSCASRSCSIGACNRNTATTNSDITYRHCINHLGPLWYSIRPRCQRSDCRVLSVGECCGRKRMPSLYNSAQHRVVVSLVETTATQKLTYKLGYVQPRKLNKPRRSASTGRRTTRRNPINSARRTDKQANVRREQRGTAVR